LEEILDYFVFLLALNKILNSVHSHVKELINIFLNHGINGLSIDILESAAELLWIVVLLLHFH
jgi:hypothetical protein